MESGLFKAHNSAALTPDEKVGFSAPDLAN